MSAKKPIIFLGPCLPRAEARALLDADYRPPVRRGDVLAAAREAPPLIGIIDGVFMHTLAPSPREVLQAIETGVPILGSSSLGALRAVELEPFGMVGVGRIFEMFKRRELIADDEVALVFSSEDLRALSEPLVNIRHALAAAEREGLISGAERRRLIRIGREIYFPERSYRRLFREAEGRVRPEALAALEGFVRSGDHDLKASDARALLVEARRRL
ncbi:TfuA-like protein [Sorangium sp. So ce118]